LGDDGAEAAAGAGDGDDPSVKVGAHEVDAIRLLMSLLTLEAQICCTRRAIGM
jgi:hypothetical protein